MAAPHNDRRLAAILAVDVAGCSRLVSHDEKATIARLKVIRQSLVQQVIARHDGRLVKLMGDGALVEFISAVGAVEAAVEIQGAMAWHDAGRADDDRIGINLGDILGDGVNVAARLERMAEPGGICAASNIHEQVRDRVSYACEDLGKPTVKDIPHPVRV